MGVAEILSSMREHVRGTVKFIFQPAEETPPLGEEGGARLMIEQGCMDNPKVDAIFGLHITSKQHANTIGYRAGPLMASSDQFRISVRGMQTHGAQPWSGIDPIVVGSQIVMGLQTIVSRKMNLTEEPSVVTVGSFHAGNRSNIIPDEAKMEGTIRAFHDGHREELHQCVHKISTLIAESGGATASVQIAHGYPVTSTTRASPTGRCRCFGAWPATAQSMCARKTCGAEDFSYYQREVPGFFFFIGCTPPERDCKSAPSTTARVFSSTNPAQGRVRTMTTLALDWLNANA